MQALSIYVLMRVDEGETDHNNVDSLMVKAMTVSHAQVLISLWPWLNELS